MLSDQMMTQTTDHFPSISTDINLDYFLTEISV